MVNAQHSHVEGCSFNSHPMHGEKGPLYTSGVGFSHRDRVEHLRQTYANPISGMSILLKNKKIKKIKGLVSLLLF